jgi:hypothetical protein
MKTKNSRLVVVYALPLALSLATWLFGWGILWNILPSGGALPKNSPGPWFDLLFWASVVSVNGLLGPLLALKYSLSIHLQEDQLYVQRYFGLFRRSYKLSDIVAVDVISSDAKIARVKIGFLNGDSLTVSGYASRFQELCSALESR